MSSMILEVVGEGRFELPACEISPRVCRVIPYRAGITQAELRMFLPPRFGENTQIRNHTMLDHPPTLIDYLLGCETVYEAAGGI